jgi:uncharacterized membrane protein YjdF
VWNTQWLRRVRRIPKPDGMLSIGTQHAIAHLGFLSTKGVWEWDDQKCGFCDVAGVLCSFVALAVWG